MGDPKKQRRKYKRPQHLWKTERITEENELSKKYGLKNKKEIWRAKSVVRRFRQQARILLGSSGEEVEKEKKELVTRLNKLGILNTNSVEGILPLTVNDLFERRLQTILYRKGLANTIKQARQLVVHGNVLVGENIIDVPGYTVVRDEEGSIRVVDGIKVINVEQGKESPEPAKG